MSLPPKDIDWFKIVQLYPYTYKFEYAVITLKNSKILELPFQDFEHSYLVDEVKKDKKGCQVYLNLSKLLTTKKDREELISEIEQYILRYVENAQVLLQ